MTARAGSGGGAETVVDAGRLAVPRADGADIEPLLEALARRDSSWGIELPRPPEPGEPTLFDGRVALRHRPRPAMREPDFRPAPLDHPHLARAQELVERWPAAAAQVAALTSVLVPLTSAAIGPERRPWVLGSSSYSDEKLFGVVLATVEDPLGLAQAIVQETARARLRVLGVFADRAHRLLVNAADERATSPVRADGPRPVPEVFGDVYSFLHVTALDLEMIAAETDPETLDRLVLLLAGNAPRVRAGCREVRRVVRTDAEGGRFVESMLAWADQVLERCETVLDRHGFGFPELVG